MAEHPIWRYVGYVFTALGVFYLSTQIWDRLNSPSDDLVAQVEFGPFYLPPLLESQFESFGDLSDFNKLAQSIELEKLLADQDDKFTRSLAFDILREISLLLLDKLPRSIPSEITQISGYWSVRVENAGPTSLSGVTITLPNTAYISLKREGSNTQNHESREVILIGDLRPREVVRLTAWSFYGPTMLATDDIKLTHAKGLGEVSIRAPAGAFGRWIEDYWGFLIIMIVAFSPIGFLLIVAVTDVKRKNTVETKETAETDHDGKSDGANKDIPEPSPNSKSDGG